MTTAAQSAAGGGLSWQVAAGWAVTVLVAVLTLWVNGRRNERQRRRELYADAWAAVQAYKEFAFAIRRRNHKEPEEERVRISEALREVQKDLAYYDALVGRERSGAVAANYRVLVAKTREIAGGLMRDAWISDPITRDDQMNMPDVAQALAPLTTFETAYLTEMENDLAWTRDFTPRGR